MEYFGNCDNELNLQGWEDITEKDWEAQTSFSFTRDTYRLWYVWTYHSEQLRNCDCSVGLLDPPGCHSIPAPQQHVNNSTAGKLINLMPVFHYLLLTEKRHFKGLCNFPMFYIKWFHFTNFASSWVSLLFFLKFYFSLVCLCTSEYTCHGGHRIALWILGT